MATPVLDRRALNRATLSRQLLLSRQRLTPLRAIERLVGLQAQVPRAPYFGLWARLAEFRPRQLSELLLRRRVVRLALLRGTLHLVTAADALSLRPAMQPVLDRWLKGAFARRLAGVDLARLAEEAGRTFEAGPLTSAELGAVLHERYPRADVEALGNAARGVLALVQVPPRGVWGASGKAAHTTLEQWLGKPQRRADPDALVLRYLAAFGPASVKDAEAWSGLTQLRGAFERLRPRLSTFRSGSGVELFDLPRAPRPGADTPAPPRFLPDYDNVLLAYADRSRILDDADKARISTRNGLLPTLLLDGFAAAAWRLEEPATLRIEPFRPLRRVDRAAVEEEGEELLAFAAPDATRRRIRFA